MELFIAIIFVPFNGPVCHNWQRPNQIQMVSGLQNQWAGLSFFLVAQMVNKEEVNFPTSPSIVLQPSVYPYV